MKKQQLLQSIRESIHKSIVGQEKLIDRLLICLLCDGHVLIEGVPGLAKTKTLKSLTKAINCKMERIQFTPDLLPSDIIGTEVYRPQSSEFIVRKGPIFANLLLGDEINRAPAKVQSALLQAMEEKEVTIGDTTFKLPKPFLVLATQNPLEHDGTYPLPEAQLDRFFMKVVITYPSFEEELKIVQQYGRLTPEQILEPVADVKDIEEMQIECNQIYVDERLERYIVTLVHQTRSDAKLLQGSSPRGSIALRKASQANAYVNGKSFVTPEDVKEVACDVLRHRVIFNYDTDFRSNQEILNNLIQSCPVP